VEPSARGWGVLGLGAGAPGAVAAELSRPQWYAAGVGLGGHYQGLGPGLLSAGLPGVRLLLADAQRDTAGQQSAQWLRRALTGVPQADVRLSDTVRDLTDQSERVRLARLSAGYLAEQMATDTRP
jgi:cysteine synthase